MLRCTTPHHNIPRHSRVITEQFKLIPVGLLLQAEQQARLEAQLELNRQKKKVAGLEAEVQQQRTAMHQVRYPSAVDAFELARVSKPL